MGGEINIEETGTENKRWIMIVRKTYDEKEGIVGEGKGKRRRGEISTTDKTGDTKEREKKECMTKKEKDALK